MLFINFYRQLWQQSRKATISLTVFVAFNLFFVYKQVDSFPFFLYGMYSGKAYFSHQATIYKLKINGHDFSSEKQMPMLAQSVLYSNLAFFSAIKTTGAAKEANLRAVIASRLSIFVATEKLPKYQPYFEAHLCNSTTAEPAKMQAWLSRYLSPYIGKKIDSISVWQIHINVQGSTSAPVDSFLLL
jgi:hypothetical protein